MFRVSGRRWRSAIFLGCCAVIVFGPALPRRASGSKIERFLSAEDLAGRVLLDQFGEPLTVVADDHRRRLVAGGSSPAYLVIPLHGGEHIPKSVPTLTIALSPSDSSGNSLKLSSNTIADLDALFATSRLVVLDLPGKSELIESLSARGHSAAPAVPGLVSTLTGLLNTGSRELTELSQRGMSELERLLNLNNSSRGQSPVKGPSLNLEAQMLAAPVPPPIPEPSTWLVFAGPLLGAAAARGRCPRRRR
jgi:hypothetical protein